MYDAVQITMVRRHRISEDEVKPVMRAVFRRLSDMATIDPLPEDAYSLFTVLWRFKEHRTGPPHYPEVTHDAIVNLLHETAGIIG